MSERSSPAGPGTLFIVRHGEPAASPDVPPSLWPLTEAGAAASARLRRALPAESLMVSSNEVKAWMTLGGTCGVVRDEAFDEVRRNHEPWGGDYRSLRRRFVQGEDLDGWETRADVARRFDQAVRAYAARAGSRPLVVASHGMTMTTWLVDRQLLDHNSAGRFWEDLTFPDLLRVDLAGGAWERPHID